MLSKVVIVLNDRDCFKPNKKRKGEKHNKQEVITAISLNSEHDGIGSFTSA